MKMARRRFFWIAAALWLIAGPALAQPQWSSDQIRAARPIGPVDGVAFDVRIETARGDAEPDILQAAVTLTATFDEMASPSGHSLDDYTLCRVLTWSATRMENESCYVSPAFRVFELGNRQVLARVIPKAASGTAYDTNPYWDEAELGVAPADRLTVRRTDQVTEFKLGEAVVARASGKGGDLTPEQMRWMTRWLARRAMLHPQVRRELAAGALPAQIQTDARAGAQHQRQVIAISNLRHVQAAYPLPAGLTSSLRGSVAEDARSKGVAATLAALDGKPLRPKPALADILAGMDAASQAGRHMEALMLFMNLTQQYAGSLRGPDREAVSGKIRAMMQAAKGDPEVEAFLNASELAGGSRAAGDRQAAATFLAGATDMDALPFGAFRRVTYANLMRAADTSKWPAATRAGMPSNLTDNYWLHIATYPWSANAFKDAGDTYLIGYDTPSAWLAYDLGRAIDPDWRDTAMGRIEALEKQVRDRAPDFF